MRFLPPRRWFQFRLSTWFVLVAILAWAMTHWPTYWDGYSEYINHWPADRITFIDANTLHFAYGGLGRYILFWRFKLFLEAFLVPALALAAFLAWKAAWAVVERRLAHPARPTPLSHDR
jgi:hypothetical protein